MVAFERADGKEMGEELVHGLPRRREMKRRIIEGRLKVLRREVHSREGELKNEEPDSVTKLELRSVLIEWLSDSIEMGGFKKEK